MKCLVTCQGTRQCSTQAHWHRHEETAFSSLGDIMSDRPLACFSHSARYRHTFIEVVTCKILEPLIRWFSPLFEALKWDTKGRTACNGFNVIKFFIITLFVRRSSHFLKSTVYDIFVTSSSCDVWFTGRVRFVKNVFSIAKHITLLYFDRLQQNKNHASSKWSNTLW